MYRTFFVASTALLSLYGCATPTREDFELPDTLVEGAADSWSHPTAFGVLFEDTWQYGALSPTDNIRNPAFTFAVDGSATIEIVTRRAPLSEDYDELGRTVIYLYKQEPNGTHRRIAKSEVSDDYGVLARGIEQGTYRVLVKGVDTDDAGQFMIRLGCEGDGCADGPQCLLPDTYPETYSLRYGALQVTGRTRSDASNVDANEAAQILAAVNQGGSEVSTIEEAFQTVDDYEINRHTYADKLSGRTITAYEYGAGGNSCGALFVGNDSTAVAWIGDGDIFDCEIFAQTCVFGPGFNETAHMPEMTSTSTAIYLSADDVPAEVTEQVIAAVSVAGSTPTLPEVFETIDDQMVWVRTYRHADGREFVAVAYEVDGAHTGSYFAKGQTAKLAGIDNYAVTDCNAFY